MRIWRLHFIRLFWEVSRRWCLCLIARQIGWNNFVEILCHDPWLNIVFHRVVQDRSYAEKEISSIRYVRFRSMSHRRDVPSLLFVHIERWRQCCTFPVARRCRCDSMVENKTSTVRGQRFYWRHRYTAGTSTRLLVRSSRTNSKEKHGHDLSLIEARERQSSASQWDTRPDVFVNDHWVHCARRYGGKASDWFLPEDRRSTPKPLSLHRGRMATNAFYQCCQLFPCENKSNVAFVSVLHETFGVVSSTVDDGDVRRVARWVNNCRHDTSSFLPNARGRERDRRWKFLRSWGTNVNSEDENLFFSLSLPCSSSFRLLEDVIVNALKIMNRLWRCELVFFSSSLSKACT